MVFTNFGFAGSEWTSKMKILLVSRPGEPELAAVVGESAVMRLVPSADGIAVDDFAVGGRTGLHVHDDEFVRAVAESFDAERPDIDEFLLPFDAGEVGRGAGFIGARNSRAESETEREDASEDCRRNSGNV